MKYAILKESYGAELDMIEVLALKDASKMDELKRAFILTVGKEAMRLPRRRGIGSIRIEVPKIEKSNPFGKAIFEYSINGVPAKTVIRIGTPVIIL